MRNLIHFFFFLVCTFAAFKVNCQQLHFDISNLKSISIILQIRDTAGMTWKSYKVVKKKIMIYHKPIRNSSFTEHVHTQRKINFKVFKGRISNLNFDTLSLKYYNKCLDSNLGKRYVIVFKTRKSQKVITMHEYYLDVINTLIDYVNDLLPQYAKLEYFPSTKTEYCK